MRKRRFTELSPHPTPEESAPVVHIFHIFFLLVRNGPLPAERKFSRNTGSLGKYPGVGSQRL